MPIEVGVEFYMDLACFDTAIANLRHFHRSKQAIK